MKTRRRKRKAQILGPAGLVNHKVGVVSLGLKEAARAAHLLIRREKPTPRTINFSNKSARERSNSEGCRKKPAKNWIISTKART